MNTQKQGQTSQAKCAHPVCDCFVNAPARYCSDACAQAAQSGSPEMEACACGHPGCMAESDESVKDLAQNRV